MRTKFSRRGKWVKQKNLLEIMYVYGKARFKVEKYGALTDVLLLLHGKKDLSGALTVRNKSHHRFLGSHFALTYICQYQTELFLEVTATKSRKIHRKDCRVVLPSSWAIENVAFSLTLKELSCGLECICHGVFGDLVSPNHQERKNLSGSKKNPHVGCADVLRRPESAATRPCSLWVSDNGFPVQE